MNIQENKRYFHFQQYCLSLRTGKIPRMKKQFLENFVFVEICGKRVLCKNHMSSDVFTVEAGCAIKKKNVINFR